MPGLTRHPVFLATQAGLDMDPLVPGCRRDKQVRDDSLFEFACTKKAPRPIKDAALNF